MPFGNATMNEGRAPDDNPDTPFDAKTFREALGLFATGVTIITTIAADGSRVGITANSFSSVSLDPPLVLFSIARKAYSLSAFQQAGRFVINVLAADQAPLSNRFATPSSDKWQGIEHESWAGCPIIPGSLAHFECRTQTMYDEGDHVIIVGRVVRLAHVGSGDPLLFFHGLYRHLQPLSVEFAGRGSPPVFPPLTGLDPWFSG